MPMKNPPHPGDLIKTEIVEALGLNVSKAAEILKVRRATLSDLLHGKAVLTREMALRIEKAFGSDMDHLLACSSPTTWQKRGSTDGTCRSSGMSGLAFAARVREFVVRTPTQTMLQGERSPQPRSA